MKKLQTIFLLMILLVTFDTKSQELRNRDKSKGMDRDKLREERKEKIESAKIGFITNKLNLTVEQAQKFWPLYNEMQQKLQSIREPFEKRTNTKDINSLSESDINSQIEERFKQKQNELNIEKEYYQKFKLVLKPAQVLQLIKAENDFKTELMDRIRKRMNNMPPPDDEERNK